MKSAIAFVLFVSVFYTVLACDGGGTARILPITLFRFVIIPNVPAPQALTTEFRFVLEFGKEAGDFNRDDGPYWIKAEIDYGDAGGWIDYTQAMSDYQAGNITQDELPSHIYTEPGTYTVRARVIYWDGEVYESDPYIVTVLRPSEGDGA